MVGKKIFRFLLVVCWLVVIFYFSNQPGNKSAKQSESVMYVVVDIVSNKPKEEKEQIVKDYNYLFRKIAHFSEYLILAILIYRFLILYKINYFYIISFSLCLVLAFCDEYHQSFINERSCSVSDVIIDSTGSLLGLILYYKLIEHKK